VRPAEFFSFPSLGAIDLGARRTTLQQTRV
jgi:hypothetical protein